MSLKLNFKGSILNLPHSHPGDGWHPTCAKFETLGVMLQLYNGDITLDGFIVGGIQELLNYQVTNTGLTEYIESFTFDCALPKGFERQVGRYKFATASGRVALDHEGKYHLYVGATNLDDLKTLVTKIEDGEIWPYKIPAKEHIPAFKFYRKTYGVPMLLIIVGLFLACLTLVAMNEEPYLGHVRTHDMAAILMVQSLWGIILACLAGSYWMYLFSKDIKPVLRKVIGVTVFIGLSWFCGCFYYIMFTIYA